MANSKMADSVRATRTRHAAMRPRAISLKLQTDKINNEQREALERVFLEAKWLRNAALGSKDPLHFDAKLKYIQGFDADRKPVVRELKQISMMMRQSVLTELSWNMKSLAGLKRNGHQIGGLRFATEIRSITLKKFGQTHKLRGSKLKLERIPGWFRVLGTKQLDGLEISSAAKLVRKPSGYYLVLSCYDVPNEEQDLLPPVGIDFGAKTLLTLSDGREFNHRFEEPERLRRWQRKLQRRVKGSKGWWEARNAVRAEYEKLSHRKADTVNKIVAEILLHEKVVIQDDYLPAWKRRKSKRRGSGRKLQHSGLGSIKAKLAASTRTIVLDRWTPTTQLCPSCGTLNKHTLSQRTYSCTCGYSSPRDLHAARNMLLFAALIGGGPAESTAVENGSSGSAFNAELRALAEAANDEVRSTAKPTASASS